jgi:DNA-binding XRE family transcriptional regulator
MLHRTKQTTLAKKIGVFKQDIAHVGRGRYDGGRVVEAVAEAMQCSVDWLLKGLGAPPAWWPADTRAAPDPLDLAAKALGMDTESLAKALGRSRQTPAEMAAEIQRLKAEGEKKDEALREKQAILDIVLRRQTGLDGVKFSRRLRLPPRVPK